MITVSQTEKIKEILMNYYRFQRQKIVATEVFTIYNYSCYHNIADIMFFDPINIKNRKIGEVEIKISKADFLNEEKKRSKRLKHEAIKKVFNQDRLPNLFYFCVPKELKEYALEKIKKINPKYGLLIIINNSVSTVKKAKPIHLEFSTRLENTIIQRLSSMVVRELSAKHKIIHNTINDTKYWKNKYLEELERMNEQNSKLVELKCRQSYLNGRREIIKGNIDKLKERLTHLECVYGSLQTELNEIDLKIQIGKE